MTGVQWLLVSSRHHPDQGGIGTYVHRFIEAAAVCGWSVDVLTRPGLAWNGARRIIEIETPDFQKGFIDRVQRLRQLDLIRPYRYGLWSLAVARAMLRLTPQYDAVEFVDCQAEGFVSLSSRLVRSRWRDVPLLVHAHLPMFVEERLNRADPTRFGRPLYHRWERETLDRADGVMTSSVSLSKLLSIQRPCLIEPLPLQLPRAPERSADAENPSIVMVGSLQRSKGVLDWVRSLNAVFREHPTARATAIGRDTPTGPGGSAMSKHLPTLLDVGHRHRFTMMTQLGHREVLREVGNASIVVLPSYFESFSFAAVEAIERRVPIIASDAVGLIEHVSSVPTVGVGDWRQLAARQLAMLSDRCSAQENVDCSRRQLAAVTDPHLVLAKRLCFARRVAKHSSQAPMEVQQGNDAIDEMECFLRSVEAAEMELKSSSVRS